MKLNFYSESEIVNCIISEDFNLKEKVWRSLYFKNYPKVKRFVKKYNGSDQDVVDVFHDGLLILNRNIKNGDFKGESSVNTYLFSICKNIWFKQVKKIKRTMVVDLETEEVSNLTNVENDVKNSKLIEAFLDQLSFDCREILIEFYYQKKTMEELKEKFNLGSIQAAKNKKCRCLSYLARLFKENGVNLEALYNHE